ncbi:branched-chain amino acid ABC transporter permease [Paenibacillus naphthalenovorans]|uniref:High-affinity branched-chain amino acid transport system permease protein LivH n=1 Tax=Paenibacillus naphthalenovorans TaxID=162209 RepID=A0A0U2W7Y0_9BACL|nr:branched-chain amino acid ABC transporter permease [Paenibacillus naphthalenovorans]ALS22558.1 high-affinity branched-chain amino acid transport system permease protein LivH [Paenibacillus naphthalenovorans]
MLLQQLVNGLTIGMIYALIALGYTMVYGILKIVNFAHGDIYMFGSFLGLFLIDQLNMPLLPTFVISAASTAVIGMIIERVAYRPLRLSDRIVPLISALGVSTFLISLAQKLWGTGTHPFPTTFGSKTYTVGHIIFSQIQILILVLSLILMIGLHLFVTKTKTGTAMRATSMSIPHASLMGINTNRMITLAFAIGSALAACAGIMVGIYYNAVYPTMGYMAGINAFTAAVLGGIGSIPGAMLGGILFGVIENLGGAYISTPYQSVISFSILIIVLLIRPTGILGKKEINKV